MLVGLQETLTEVIVAEDPPPPTVLGPTQPATREDKIPITTSQTGQSQSFLEPKVRTKVTIAASLD
jgi:hypothetical protein